MQAYTSSERSPHSEAFYKKSLTAEKLVYTFLRVLAANYKILDKIILNRNKFFILKFWKFLTDQLEVHYKLSTVYYLQINEQMKRLN